MIKLLHTADWQIGKLFGQFDADEAALLAEARFTTVASLARLATAEGVDAVLVAGDVFDAQGVADKTIQRLFQCLEGFAGPWLMISGNHDAGLSESVWTRAARLKAIPPHVSLCLLPEVLILPCLAVLPAPLTQRITYDDLTVWFDHAETPAGLPRIGLAHGSVQGILAEGIDSSNPIAAERSTRARLDYLALGDWHGTRQVDARCWYAGTPETDRFKANDSGNALIVELDGPGALPRVRPVATGQHRWRSDAFALHVPSDADAVIEQLAAYGAADVVQLVLAGHCDLATHRRLGEAIGKARGRARSLTADLGGLRLEPTAADIAALRADGYLGEVIATLRCAQSDGGGDQAELARDALALLTRFLDEQRDEARS